MSAFTSFKSRWRRSASPAFQDEHDSTVKARLQALFTVQESPEMSPVDAVVFDEANDAVKVLVVTWNMGDALVYSA
jgi:hypothetical protein